MCIIYFIFYGKILPWVKQQAYKQRKTTNENRVDSPHGGDCVQETANDFTSWVKNQKPFQRS